MSESSSVSARRRPRWVAVLVGVFAGALLILANWPYTLLVIKPTNDRLHAIMPAQSDAGTRQMIVSWGHLHAGRSALGVAATLCFLWALR